MKEKKDFQNELNDDALTFLEHSDVQSTILVDDKTYKSVKQKEVILIEKKMIETMKTGLSISNSINNLESWWNTTRETLKSSKLFSEEKFIVYENIRVNGKFFRDEEKKVTKNLNQLTQVMHISKSEIQALIKKMEKENCHWIEVRHSIDNDNLWSERFFSIHILNFKEFFDIQKKKNKKKKKSSTKISLRALKKIKEQQIVNHKK